MSNDLPITQFQGFISGIILIVLVVFFNVANGLSIQNKLNEANKQLKEVSQQLLIQAGYLKDHRDFHEQN